MSTTPQSPRARSRKAASRKGPCSARRRASSTAAAIPGAYCFPDSTRCERHCAIDHRSGVGCQLIWSSVRSAVSASASRRSASSCRWYSPARGDRAGSVGVVLAGISASFPGRRLESSPRPPPPGAALPIDAAARRMTRPARRRNAEREAKVDVSLLPR